MKITMVGSARIGPLTRDMKAEGSIMETVEVEIMINKDEYIQATVMDCHIELSGLLLDCKVVKK